MLAMSGVAGHRGTVEQEKVQCRVTVNGGAGYRAGAGAGEVTVDAWSREQQVSRLLLISLSNHATRHEYIVIKK
jgi:hypothetical protein